jgi:type I restriction enzyme S subunit
MTANNQVAEASVKYLVEAAGQAVPIGYKQTEAGVIPEDWNTPRFGDICSLINGRGFKPYEWSSEGLPIIRIQNLNGSDDFNYYSGHFDSKIFIQNGQLLFAWSGSRGTSFGPHIWKGSDALLNYHTWKLVIKDLRVEDNYFFHILKLLTRKIEDSAHGASALVHTQKGEMEQFFVPLPRSREEQAAIANALSDVDALINELEKLIAKKQAIKTATMQQLLTGRTRLPQFALREDGTPKGYKQSELGEIPEDWKIVALNDLASIRSGGTPSTKIAEYWDGEVNWCTPTDITALQGNKYLEKTARTITELGVIKSAAEVLPIGTIVMTSRATIGECAIVQQEMTTNQGFKSFICNSMGNNEFLYYLLGTLKDRFIGLCSGSTFLEISTTQVRSFLVAIPEKEEQTAIATILSDMDEEIQTLQKRLAKTSQIKQGMMQELLTGKTRLVKPAQKEVRECLS